MAGVYLHVPFCKQACYYCDFHFSVNTAKRPEMVDALATELALRADYLTNERVDTIYFGGGTPSLLTPRQVAHLLGAVAAHFSVAPNAEVTLEANPDDLSFAYLRELYAVGVNRLSVGIQSFQEETLRWMNRAHTAHEATVCVDAARKVGFENLSVDLIYGVPADDHTRWQADLDALLSLAVPHVSAYCLTIEPDTVFGRRQARGQLAAAPDAFAVAQYEMLTEALAKAGYEHYEVSSFALPGRYSRHNTAYWQQVPYLGVGPSAHSFEGTRRQANVANNGRYLRAVEQGEVPATVEVLTAADRANEYLITSLRTRWGCELRTLEGLGYDLAAQQPFVATYRQRGWLRADPDRWVLTTEGMLWADQIAAELFV